DVARTALVLDDLRNAMDCQPGAFRTRVRDRRTGAALRSTAGLPAFTGGQSSRSWKPSARIRDAVGVHVVRTIPDHLVRQSPRGDSLVSEPIAQRLAVDRGCIDYVSFLCAVFSHAQPLQKTANSLDRCHCNLGSRHADRRYVLDHYARVL